MRIGKSKLLGVLVAVAAILVCAACVVAVEDRPSRRIYTPPPGPPRPVFDDDYGMFYDDLDPYGEWIRLDNYGWVWSPWRIEPGWRPYTMGRWIYTDDGWFWESEEPWGWAVYHYGRWTFQPRYGWVWIPGREWAPAWVAWRHGDGWVGWAPLPPQANWRVGIGLDLGGVDIDVVIQPFWWGFVETRMFLEPRVGRHCAPPGRNVTLVRSTRHVTRYTVNRNRVFDHGVDVGEFEKESRRKIVPHRIVDDDRDRGRNASVVGQEIRVWRPTLKEAPPSRVPRSAQSRESGRPADTERDRPAVSRPAQDRREVREEPKVERPVSRRLSSEEIRRQHAEQRELERRQAAERARLEQIQRQEERRSAGAASAEEIRKRHEEELRAHQEGVAREQQVLENKQERESKVEPKAEEPKEGPKVPPRKKTGPRRAKPERDEKEKEKEKPD